MLEAMKCLLLCCSHPVPLSQGNSAGHAFAVAASTFPCGPEVEPLWHHHIRLLIRQGYVWALVALLMQRQKAWNAQQASVDNVDCLPTDVIDWPVAVACANHDIQNGLKWSLATHAQSGSVVRSLYIAIAGCRNGFNHLHHKVFPSYRACWCCPARGTIASRFKGSGHCWGSMKRWPTSWGSELAVGR